MRWLRAGLQPPLQPSLPWAGWARHRAVTRLATARARAGMPPGMRAASQGTCWARHPGQCGHRSSPPSTSPGRAPRRQPVRQPVRWANRIQRRCEWLALDPPHLQCRRQPTAVHAGGTPTRPKRARPPPPPGRGEWTGVGGITPRPSSGTSAPRRQMCCAGRARAAVAGVAASAAAAPT
jgi:hypothetical protein